jgi:hypothetical protein
MRVKKVDRDLKKIEAELDKLIKESFKKLIEDIRIDLREISAGNKENGVDLKRIEKKLDRFIAILNKFSKRQDILEAKMILIEDYFDPHPQN